MESKTETRRKLIFALRGILLGGRNLSELEFEKYVESMLGDMTIDECVEIIYKSSDSNISVDSIIRAMKIYVLS